MHASLNFTVSAVSCSCAALALDRARQGGLFRPPYVVAMESSRLVRLAGGMQTGYILFLRESEINQCFFFHGIRQLLALTRKGGKKGYTRSKVKADRSIDAMMNERTRSWISSRRQYRARVRLFLSFCLIYLFSRGKKERRSRLFAWLDAGRIDALRRRMLFRAYNSLLA
jgi:hypothetical protein